MIPNTEQITAVIRWVAVVAGTWAVNHGYLNSDQLTSIIGALVAIAPLVWSFMSKTAANRVKSLKDVPGISVEIGSNAPPAVQQLLNNPGTLHVTPRKPGSSS